MSRKHSQLMEVTAIDSNKIDRSLTVQTQIIVAGFNFLFFIWPPTKMGLIEIIGIRSPRVTGTQSDQSTTKFGRIEFGNFFLYLNWNF